MYTGASEEEKVDTFCFDLAVTGHHYPQ